MGQQGTRRTRPQRPPGSQPRPGSPRAFALLLFAGALWILLNGTEPVRGQVLVQDDTDAPQARHVPTAAADGEEDASSWPAGNLGQLVAVDQELVGFLEQAIVAGREGQHDRALEILQALLDHPDSGFVPDGSHRYVSLRQRAQQALGSLPAEALQMYRAIHDPLAGRMYADAVRDGDERTLRMLVDRYLHTSWGFDAVRALGALQLDRGEFHQAAGWFHQARDLSSDEDTRGLLLAQAIVAHHLAGDARWADKAHRQLLREHRAAKADLGGQVTSLDEFARRVRMLSVPETARATTMAGSWPGVGGLSGIVPMEDCHVVLTPRWSDRMGSLSGRLGRQLLAMSSSFAEPAVPPQAQYHHDRTERVTVSSRLRGGVVEVVASQGSHVRQFPLPEGVEPVVVDDTVIYRTDEHLVSRDIYTGEVLWTSRRFPLEQPPVAGEPRAWWPGMSSARWFMDAGQYRVTVAGGRVFALGETSPREHGAAAPWMWMHNRTPPTNDSVLAAYEIRSQGKLLWRIGRGEGSSDLLKMSRYLSAPAAWGDRLYVLALHMETYRLLCLDARDGTLIWYALVGQLPGEMMGGRQSGMSVDGLLRHGTVPAVADGRVYVTNDAGILACFDAQTGSPIWAREYASHLPNWRTQSASATVYPPTNPIVVTQGRVIFLPADSGRVLALSALNGHLEWIADRRGQQVLSALDAGRLLLSGEDLVVLSSVDGRELARPSHVGRTVGRPAVLPGSVLVSSFGQILRLDLEDYSVRAMLLPDSEGLLGTLVSAGGKLVAANAAGVSTYFPFDQAYADLAERIERADSQARLVLLLRRGRMGLMAGRYDEAQEDFQTCLSLLEGSDDWFTRSQAQGLLYRTYVTRGHLAPAGGERVEWYARAGELTQTPGEEALMLLRRARAHAEADEPREAIHFAQRLADAFGSDLIDIPANGQGLRQRQEPASQAPARQVAQGLIARLVASYGPEVYSDLEPVAQAALEEARESGDTESLEAVADRWPLSRAAAGALLTVAELRYAAWAASPDDAERLGEAVDALARLVHHPLNPAGASAVVAVAELHLRQGHPTAAGLHLGPLRGLPVDTPIRFGGLEGTLGEFLERMERGEALRLAVRAAPGELVGPLRLSHQLPGEDVEILRDGFFRPVTVGDGVLVLRDSRAMLLSASSPPGEPEARWLALSDVQPELHGQSRFEPGVRLIAGVGAASGVVVTADRSGAWGFDGTTARRLWSLRYEDLGVAVFGAMGMGEDSLVLLGDNGLIFCVDMGDGSLRWRATLVGGDRTPAPPVEVAAGLVWVRHDGTRALTAFDLQTGRVRGRWQAREQVQVVVTPAGLVAVLVDEWLLLLDPARPDHPVWRQEMPQASRPNILCADDERVVVALGQARPRVRVIALHEGGRERSSFDLPRAAEQTPHPVAGALEGDSLYLLAEPQVSGSVRERRGLLSRSAGLLAMGYCLREEQLRWTRTLDADASREYVLAPLVAGPSHLVVATLQLESTGGARRLSRVTRITWLLDSSDGGIERRFDRAGQRVTMVAPPALHAGRLWVEADEGLEIYAASQEE